MIYSFLYVFVFSIALILIQKLDINIPPLYSLVVTASVATLYFNIINRKHLKKIYTDCLTNKKSWLSVMVIVLIMWATTMIGPGKIGASLFNFFYFAWLGMLGLMLLAAQDWRQYQQKFYFGLCLLTLIIANIIFELYISFSYNTIYGIFLAFLGGTASFIYFKQSQNLAKDAKLSATQVLAVRFYLAIIVLLIVLPKHHVGEYFTLINFANLILLAFFSLIIPLYFSQKALEKITSEQHAIINSTCPIITGIFQEIVFNDLSTQQLSIYFLYTLVIVGFYFMNKHSKKWNLTIVKNIRLQQ